MRRGSERIDLSFDKPPEHTCLRDNEASYPNDFIGYWLDRLIFYDAPAGVFIVVYFTFGALVLLTF